MWPRAQSANPSTGSSCISKLLRSRSIKASRRQQQNSSPCAAMLLPCAHAPAWPPAQLNQHNTPARAAGKA
eukprot:3807593-Pleurochrysis_carterae.AAC.1